MEARKKRPQRLIEENIQLFFQELKEPLPKNFISGLCNGFAFLNFRANLMGELPKAQERLEKLRTMSPEQITSLATEYKKYKDNYSKMHSQLVEMNSELRRLEHEYKEKDKTKFKKLKDDYDKLKEDFDKLKIKNPTIEAAEDIYIYTQSLCAAFDPGASLKLSVPAKHEETSYQPVSQHEFEIILDTLLPLTSKNTDTEPVTVGFRLAACLNIQTWFTILRNILKPHDHLALASLDHIIYASCDAKGNIHIYDPNHLVSYDGATGKITKKAEHFNDTEYKVGQSAPESLTKFLLYNFCNPKINAMPLSINIFSNQNHEPRKIKGSTRDEYLSLTLHKADLDREISGISTIVMAADAGDAKLVQLCLERKAALDIQAGSKKLTALYLAAQNGHASVVNLLLKAKATTSLASDHKITPLAVAAGSGHAPVVQALFEYKTDLNQVDINGWSPAFHAAKNGEIDALEVLARNKAYLSLADKKGSTPLDIALVYGHRDVVSLLIKYGINIDKPDPKGLTKLHHAIQKSEVNMIEILIQNGANPFIPSGTKSTRPFDSADDGLKQFVLVQMLKKFIADDKSENEFIQKLQSIVRKAKTQDDCRGIMKEIYQLAKGHKDYPKTSFFSKKPEPPSPEHAHPAHFGSEKELVHFLEHQYQNQAKLAKKSRPTPK